MRKDTDGAFYANGARLMASPKVRTEGGLVGCEEGRKVAQCDSAEQAAELADCYNTVHGLGDRGKRRERLHDILSALIGLHGRKEVKRMIKALR